MSVLNGDQFFHGTSHNIKDGMVRPANDAPDHVEVSESSMGDPGDMSEGDHAFAVRNDERYAWHAARNFHQAGRARVYEVEPAADMKPGPWNALHPDALEHHETDDHAEMENNSTDEWGSKTGFKIKQRLDIMPGRQGTFPQANWNRRSRIFGDANHPDDEQVRYGMVGHPQGRSTKGFVEGATRHDWRNDQAPHSELREMAGRPQKRLDTLF